LAGGDPRAKTLEQIDRYAPSPALSNAPVASR
jgi:hypothetical protein